MRNPWRGRLLALGLGLVLVLGAEGALHLVPTLSPPPLFQPLAADLQALNPSYPRRFFAGLVGGWSLEGMRLHAQPFLEPPPRETIRIVFAGASTAQGYPHPHRLAAASFLQAMLQDAWPQRQVEVINIGITSIASFAVARAVADAMALGPDLVVVYAGHNEFYGVYGAAAWRRGGRALWAKQVHYFLMQRRLTALALRGVRRVSRAEAPPISLLAALASAGRVGPDDPARRAAERALQENLTHVARTCRARGVPLVLCTLVSNETGYAPEDNAEFTALEGGERAAWAALLERAASLLERGEAVAALGELDRAAEREERSALLHFLRGRALSKLGEAGAARAAFVRARDLDPLPLRAPGSLNEKIREVALRERVLLAGVEERFLRAAPAEGVGWELMADHLHPGVAGQALLARAVLEALAEAPPGLRVGAEQGQRVRTDGELRVFLGDLPVERAALALDMARLVGEPPLNHDARQGARLQALARQLWEGLTAEERRGHARWIELQRRVPLVLCAADEFFAAGDVVRAGEHYRVARLEAPYTLWGDLWATLRWARCRQVQNGRLESGERSAVLAAGERARKLAGTAAFDAKFHAFFNQYAARLLEGAPPDGLGPDTR